MINESTYQAARTVAPVIEAHFSRQLMAAALRNETNLAPQPPAAIIESVIDAAFWASLRREEGHSPRISLAFQPPELSGQPMLFENRYPLSPASLTKLAPGVERAGIYLGVWHEAGELYVWGAIREIASFCFVLDVSEPGLLVIKHRRLTGFGKFTNVAVLKGDQIKIIDEESATLPDCPALLSSLLDFTAPASRNESVNVLVQLAVSMRAHGRGGTLIVVPHGSETWRNSVIHPLQYAIAPAFTGLANLLRQPETERKNALWLDRLNRKVESVAGLTAIDGATIISDQYELLAFGVKLTRPANAHLIEQVVLTEPVLGNIPVIMPPSQNGGTRHLSAAQFIQDQKNTLALVASQDGKFTVFTWAPCEGMVHGHRIDTLLL